MDDRRVRVRRARVAGLLALLGGATLTACAEAPEADELEPLALRGLDDGLELHWTFEDSVGAQISDLSGHQRHGTLQNGATLVPSPLGQAVRLDGVDDFISLVGPRAPALYGGVDGSFTISARVRVDDSGKYNTLCYGCGPFSTLYVGTEGYGPVVLAALDRQGSPGWIWPESSAALVDYQWRQVTLVVEDGATARYQLDCELDEELADPNIGLVDMGYSSIGQGASPGRWFEGEIDELRIWSRALSDAELAELCPTESPLEQGLEMRWTFEDHDGDKVIDMSGNGRHGTALGPSFVASPEGQALSFDGVDDLVSLVGPRSPALYGGEFGQFTVSARVRVPNVNKHNTLCYGCGPFSFWYVGEDAPGGRSVLGLWDPDAQSTAWIASTQVLEDDQWVEVSVEVLGGDDAKVYIDCDYKGPVGSPDLALRDPGYSSVGEGASPGRWFEGEIDELRVWNRILSDDERRFSCARTELCGAPIYVDIDAPPGGDGFGWATAFNNVQEAVDAGEPCFRADIYVAEGQYAPDPNLPVAELNYPVRIYGGFRGDEYTPEQRNIAAHPTRFGAEGWQSKVVVFEQGDDHDPLGLDGIEISGGSERSAISISLSLEPSQPVVLANLTLSDNSARQGAAIWAAATQVIVRNSSFVGNSVASQFDPPLGGAIYLARGELIVEDSSFVDNQAGFYGGAIYYSYDTGPHEIRDSSFSSNSAKWGGALFYDHNFNYPVANALTVMGSSFESNTTTGGGAAVYLEESIASFESTTFVGNSGTVGGAIYLADDDPDEPSQQLLLRHCRFVANSATNGAGGALHLRELGLSVVNTEFADNSATTVGGAVYGRGDFISTSFADNLAPTGSGLYAPPGATMTLDHCVAFPDTIVGADISAPYSCTDSSLAGAPQTVLGGVDPYAPADLDLDGLTERYLIPAGPCAGLDGGVIDAFDWSAMTVEQSQCTDAGWPEPGVHYEPQAAAGACE